VTEFIRWAVMLLIVCLAISMVNGAMRASTLTGVVRESMRSLVALAGGLALLIAVVEVVLLVVQQNA